MEFDETLLGYGKYVFDTFEFANGEVLRDVDVEYFISGTPKYDDEGDISNAIVYCHSYSGSCYSVNDFYKMTSDNAPLDKNEYLIISITALGFPDSCSPSTTGLKYNFPQYSVFDCVNFKRQFLRECLNIKKVLGVTGRGIGGYEVYTWACQYPDEMEFIIIADSSFKTNGYRYAMSKAVGSLIESSDGFYSDTYDVSLSKTTASIYRLIYSNYFSRHILQKMSNDEIDVLMEDFVDEGLFTDIYDLKYRNDMILNYDLEEKLQNIKARVLIFSNRNDIYYSYEYDSSPLKELIEDSEIVLYEDDDEEYPMFVDVLKNFLKK